MGDMEDRHVDISQLQREYRNMENNRKSYTDESQQVLRRQGKNISKLKADNERLKAEILLESASSSKSSASAHTEAVITLQNQIDAFATKMAVDSKHLGTLTNQTKMLQHKVLHQKKHMGGVNASRDNYAMIDKQIRILENRLDKALVKFNEALATNKNLRTEIDGLRRERVVFDNIYKRLEKELVEKKKDMANIIESSNLAYEARDNAQMEMAAIEQRSREEGDEYEVQIRDYDFKIDAHRQAAKEAHDAILLKRSGEGSASSGKKSFVEENNERVQRSTPGGTNLQSSFDRVQSFEDAFNKIKAATGIHDIEELVQTFITHEDQNFSLFNYVNEQQNEIEKLEEIITDLKSEERKYSTESGDDVTQHKQLLTDLETRLRTTEGSVDKLESKSSDAQKNVNSIKVSIQSIFNKLECHAVGSPEMLASIGDGIVTEATLMMSLGIIETRTNDILQLYASFQQQREDNKTNNLSSEKQTISISETDHSCPSLSASHMPMVLGIGPSTPMGHEQLQINPPNLEDYSTEEGSESEEEDMRPFTREELKIRTLKGIQKQKNKEAGSTRRGGK